MPTIENFCNDIKKEVDLYTTHTDLEAAMKKRKHSLVVGKLIQILYTVNKNKIIIQVEEVLPNFDCGQKFNAVIHSTLAGQFTEHALQPGDSLAFYEPFIFLNPAFQSPEIKYLLEIGGLENSRMWCANSQSPLVETKMPEKKVNHGFKSIRDETKKQATSTLDKQQRTLKELSIAVSVEDLCSNVKASKNNNSKDNSNHNTVLTSLSARKNKNEDNNPENITNLKKTEQDSLGTRQRPQNQLGLSLNAQIPLNTNKLNPKYKTLQEVRDDAFLGNMGKVNIFVVVQQIVKGLTKTTTGRFALRCKVIDESTGLNNSFHLNLFTLSDFIIQQIEKEDILRLHRMQVEKYQNIPDGRIFNEHDILLFKKKSKAPITTAKDYQITEEDKRKVERLKKWLEDSQRCSSEIRLLSSIQEEGEFHIECKLMSLELDAEGSVKLRVADGSVMCTLARGPAPPALDPISSDQASGHLVTEIEVCNQLNLLAKIKAGTFLHLCKIKAVKSDKLRLELNAQVAPIPLSEDSDAVMKINQRLEVMKRIIEESVKNKINEKDVDVSPNNQQSSENTQRTRNRTCKCCSSDCKELENTDSCTKQLQTVESATDESDLSLLSALNKLSSDKGEDLNNTDHKRLRKMSPCTTCPRTNVPRHPSKALQMKEVENRLKRYRPLFTANYRMDLSDASDDLSEVVVSGGGKEGGEGEPGPEAVVVPGTKSSPSKPTRSQVVESGGGKEGGEGEPWPEAVVVLGTKSSPSKPTRSHPQTQNSQKRKVVDNCAKGKYPYVKLIRLDNECNKSPSRTALDKIGTSSRPKKLTVEGDDINSSAEECIEIASTVKNVSYQKLFSENIKNKSVDDGSLSTQDNAVDLLSTHEDGAVIIIPKVQIEHKVAHWLSRCPGDLDQTSEPDLLAAQQLPLGLDEDDPFIMSERIRTSSWGLRVYLERVIPDPSNNPLDLVSGICVNGCKQVFIYSLIDWQTENDNYIPLCPHCKKLKLKNYLSLTLFFELQVFDMNQTDTVVVCMDQAETFLNCSTKEFLNDQEIRKSRVKQLTDSSLRYRIIQNVPGKKPVLDMSVLEVKSRLILVNTTFKSLYTP